MPHLVKICATFGVTNKHSYTKEQNKKNLNIIFKFNKTLRLYSLVIYIIVRTIILGRKTMSRGER